jgi:hypothetical protein
VAHDFNNLLMVVSGHIQTIKKGSPKIARAAEAIELATRRGQALTRQLLTSPGGSPSIRRPLRES